MSYPLFDINVLEDKVNIIGGEFRPIVFGKMLTYVVSDFITIYNFDRLIYTAYYIYTEITLNCTIKFKSDIDLSNENNTYKSLVDCVYTYSLDIVDLFDYILYEDVMQIFDNLTKKVDDDRKHCCTEERQQKYETQKKQEQIHALVKELKLKILQENEKMIELCDNPKLSTKEKSTRILESIRKIKSMTKVRNQHKQV